MSHRYHPNPEVNDPEDAIYFDDCADCEHHAKNTPYNADPTTAQELWNRMLAVEKGNDPVAYYRTENEAVACQTLWRTYIFLERFTSINPKELPFK